jgi:large subunit ribosomal protein L6
MSRIGKKPVPVTKGVKIDVKDGHIKVTGPKGELNQTYRTIIDVKVNGDTINLTRPNDEKQNKSLHGLYRALIANMVKGVTDGFEKKLEIVGVGFKAEMKGNTLQLALGFSHPIYFIAPEGVKIEAPTPTNLTIKGIDKRLVGSVADKIRSFRKPEPYKGKGIKYEGEFIRRKAGKTAASK